MIVWPTIRSHLTESWETFAIENLTTHLVIFCVVVMYIPALSMYIDIVEKFLAAQISDVTRRFSHFPVIHDPSGMESHCLIQVLPLLGATALTLTVNAHVAVLIP